MFQQEINLYHAFIEPEAPPTPLSWKRMWLCQILFVLLFALMGLTSYWQASRLNHHRIELQQKAEALQSEFYKVKSGYPAVFFTRDVEESVKQLGQEMLSREKILQKIANHGLFSNTMTVLAQTIVPNVWLTGISISKSGDEIKLNGRSNNHEKLEKYLSILTSHPIFKNYSLSINNIGENIHTTQKDDLIFEILMLRNPS